jgi:hypothetical protein
MLRLTGSPGSDTRECRLRDPASQFISDAQSAQSASELSPSSDHDSPRAGGREGIVLRAVPQLDGMEVHG